MNRRPMTFGELLGRLAPLPPPEAMPMSPLIGAAFELNGNGKPAGGRMWVVVHSVTDAELRLIHPEPIRSAKLAVEIRLPTGEILRVVLETGAARQHGELFETCARFVQAGRGILSVSA